MELVVDTTLTVYIIGIKHDIGDGYKCKRSEECSCILEYLVRFISVC